MKKIKVFLLSLLMILPLVGCNVLPNRIKNQLLETKSYTIEVSGTLNHQVDYEFLPGEIWSEISETTFRITGKISYPDMAFNLYVINIAKNNEDESGTSEITTIDYIYKNGNSYSKIKSPLKDKDTWVKEDLIETDSEYGDYIASIRDYMTSYHNSKKNLSNFVNETVEIFEGKVEGNKVSLSEDMLKDFKKLLLKELDARYINTSEEDVSYDSVGNYVLSKYTNELDKIEISSSFGNEYARTNKTHKVDLSLDVIVGNFSNKTGSIIEPNDDKLYDGVILEEALDEYLNIHLYPFNNWGIYMIENHDIAITFHIDEPLKYGETYNIVIDIVGGVNDDEIELYENYFENNPSQTIVIYGNGTYQISIPSYEEVLGN